MEKQRKHQTKFISFALGGPNQYSGFRWPKLIREWIYSLCILMPLPTISRRLLRIFKCRNQISIKWLRMLLRSKTIFFISKLTLWQNEKGLSMNMDSPLFLSDWFESSYLWIQIKPAELSLASPITRNFKPNFGTKRPRLESAHSNTTWHLRIPLRLAEVCSYIRLSSHYWRTRLAFYRVRMPHPRLDNGSFQRRNLVHFSWTPMPQHENLRHQGSLVLMNTNPVIQITVIGIPDD